VGSGCDDSNDRSTETFDLVVALEALPAGAAPVQFRGVNAWVVRQQDGSVDAFWARSPHRGCFVMLHEQGSSEYARLEDFHLDLPGVLRDVCFGSTFLLTGERVFGPSWRGLDSFEVIERESTADGRRVTIDFSRVTLGTCGAAGSHPDRPCSPPGEPVTVDGPALVDWP
jgi:hypothetical protein